MFYNANVKIMSLRGTSRGLTSTAYGDIGDTILSYSSTLGCDVGICWKATLLVVALPRDPHVETKTVSPRDDIVRNCPTLFICK